MKSCSTAFRCNSTTPFAVMTPFPKLECQNFSEGSVPSLDLIEMRANVPLCGQHYAGIDRHIKSCLTE